MQNIKDPIDFSSLIGDHILTGCDITTEQVLEYGETHVSAGVIRFVMDGVTYEAIEDPNDGYRSTLEGLQKNNKIVKNIFDPIEVTASHKTKSGNESWASQVDDVLQLRIKGSDVLILEVGTEGLDDYYPGCVMNFSIDGIK